MKRRPRALTPRAAGFTLVEMLVVIGIIGILVGLLFPAVGTLRNAANNARALQEAKSMAYALMAYRNDYGRFPLQTHANNDFAYTGADHANLLRILRADGTYGDIQVWNPRRNVYLEIPEQTIVGGLWRDPWGTQYRIAVDFNGDHRIDSSLTGGHGTLTNVAAAVWSYGRDQASGTEAQRRDDVLSW